MSDQQKPLQTSDIARELGLHVNTIRIYEERGFLPTIPRGSNGYREYTSFHLEQARLAQMATQWPYLVESKPLLDRMVCHAALCEFEMAIELAYRHLANVPVEHTYAEAAVTFLERWAAGYLHNMDSSSRKMQIKEVAEYLKVSVDMLRNWERNGLIDVPRDSKTGYRLYGVIELGRLRVIRILVQSGHSLMAVLRMLHQFDSGSTENLRDALELPHHESANEHITIIADRWLSGLLELEHRAQCIIQQINTMIMLKHAC